jgi:AMP-binding enzyme C-terminal domain
VADQLEGQIPIGFAVLKAGVERPHEGVAAELIALVRERVGPVAFFKTVAIVDALPKTRSGKPLRATIRKMADGEDWSVPATIEDAGRGRARRLRRSAAAAGIRKGRDGSGTAHREAPTRQWPTWTLWYRMQYQSVHKGAAASGGTAAWPLLTVRREDNALAST